MILKVRDNNQSNDNGRFAAAGNNAEDQMSLYLKRAFEREPNVYAPTGIRANPLQFYLPAHFVAGRFPASQSSITLAMAS